MTGPRARPWCARVAALCAAAGLLVLGGCASPGAAPAAAAPTITAPPAAPATMLPAPATGLASFELTMQQRAQDAERQGQLADAAWAWEALSLARPARGDAAAELARLRGVMQSRVTAALAQAQQDRQRGELERAMRGYLTVLSLQSEHRGAAEALRAIERERNERQFLGRFSPKSKRRARAPGLPCASARQVRSEGAAAWPHPLSAAAPDSRFQAHRAARHPPHRPTNRAPGCGCSTG